MQQKEIKDLWQDLAHHTNKNLIYYLTQNISLFDIKEYEMKMIKSHMLKFEMLIIKFFEKHPIRDTDFLLKEIKPINIKDLANTLCNDILCLLQQQKSASFRKKVYF